mmetsp:Transcript_18153/g.44892  ORF Transcript_18153/g.44892 Transcript_18153/m.44892 type:complete len:629 (-) Transcript_18153:303-2189(-)
MNKLFSKNLALLLSFTAPAVIYGQNPQCVTCPGGIEFPDADPRIDSSGSITCSMVDAHYNTADGVDPATCVEIIRSTMQNCCPSQLPNNNNFPTQNNACGWCPNGVTDIASQIIRLPGISDPLSCGDIMLLIATEGQDTTYCDIALATTEMCCPGDGGGNSSGYDCQFCASGVEFPELVVPAADNFTCAQIDFAAALANETICSTLVQPLESECCPNNSVVAPTPVPVTEPPVPQTPQCVFCPQGLETEELDLSFLEGLNFTFDGILDGLTCTDLQLGAAFSSNEACVDDIKPLESLCCPSTTDNYLCDWCSGEVGVEFPDREIPTAGLDLPVLTCATVSSLVGAISSEESCSDFKTSESICCPTTSGAIQCDFCSGPNGLEFPDNEIGDNGITCKDVASYALGAPDEDFCKNLEATQGLCCPSSTGVSLPPVAEGEYCYICGSADVEMTKPDHQPFALGASASNDPDDLVTCAEIEAQINAERGAGESCGSVIADFTARLSPSICGCAGVEPPNACKFCDGKVVKRDVELPEEDFTCGEGYDYVKHFTSTFDCDAPNTEFEEVEKLCCGDDLVSPSRAPSVLPSVAPSTVPSLTGGGGSGGGDSAAGFVGTGVFVAFVSLFAVFVLA